MNEELVPESFLNLTLTQLLRDEDPKLQEVCVRVEVEPPRVWYYYIFSNSRTLVILLQIDPLLAMNLKPSVKVVMKLKTRLFSCGFQFSMLATTVSYIVQFADFLLIARQTT